MRQHQKIYHYVAFFMLLCLSISHSFSQIYGYELKGESAVTLAMYNITFYPTYIIINPTGKISYISANIAEVESYLSTLGLSK